MDERECPVSVAERLRELADRCVARNAMTVESGIYVKDLAAEVAALEARLAELRDQCRRFAERVVS